MAEGGKEGKGSENKRRRRTTREWELSSGVRDEERWVGGKEGQKDPGGLTRWELEKCRREGGNNRMNMEEGVGGKRFMIVQRRGLSREEE